jgi:hypothetical protein
VCLRLESFATSEVCYGRATPFAALMGLPVSLLPCLDTSCEPAPCSQLSSKASRNVVYSFDHSIDERLKPVAPRRCALLPPYLSGMAISSLRFFICSSELSPSRPITCPIHPSKDQLVRGPQTSCHQPIPTNCPLRCGVRGKKFATEEMGKQSENSRAMWCSWNAHT